MTIIATYSEQEKAVQDVTLLLHGGIEAKLSSYHKNGGQFFNLEVPTKSVEKAKELISKIPKDVQIDSDYMFDFTDEELKEILIERQAHASIMVENAERILKSRHPEFEVADLTEDIKSRKEVASTGESAGSGQLAIGYIFALAGGLIGIAIGWFIETGKTETIHGEYYTYDEHSRKQGKVIKWIGIISLIGWLSYRMLP